MAKPVGKNSRIIWSMAMITTLIDLYEGNPCLYLTTSLDYRNRNRRNKTLVNICETLNNRYLTITKLTVKDVQGKIHSLRSQYLCELGKIKKSQVSGASNDQVYVPKWQYFGALSFIEGRGGNILSEGDSNMKEMDLQELALIETQESNIETSIKTETDLNEVFNSEVSQVPTDFSEEMMSPSGTDSEISRPTSRSSIHLKRRRISETTTKIGNTSLADKLLEKADKVLREAEIVPPRVSPNLSSKRAFAKFIELEMDKIEDEAIMDEFQMGVMKLLHDAKKENRRRMSISEN
ncbi:unnamed protein product [Ceutorhynchus assimilis]|uniref:MADF domain-containing protein n=1 Tax=Ceutorhynchus assimilis TaxID=467358 RepID=A0A9N9M8P6_9CUCU|nr:unnamed protein product [Ceutorhynchus assimilis]